MARLSKPKFRMMYGVKANRTSACQNSIRPRHQRTIKHRLVQTAIPTKAGIGLAATSTPSVVAIAKPNRVFLSTHSLRTLVAVEVGILTNVPVLLALRSADPE